MKFVFDIRDTGKKIKIILSVLLCAVCVFAPTEPLFALPVSASENGSALLTGGDIPCGKNEHSYIEEITLEPTCLENGEKICRCEKCSYEYTEIIDALGHEKTEIPEVKPTCTETGLTSGIGCSRCDKVFKEGDLLKATGHQWGEWIYSKFPTVSETGTRYKECLVCESQGTVETVDKIPADKIVSIGNESIKITDTGNLVAVNGLIIEDILLTLPGTVKIFAPNGREIVHGIEKAVTGQYIVLYDEEGKELDKKYIVVPGDINGDSKVNAADARKALRYSVKLEYLYSFEEDAAEVTGDGKVKANDARMVLRASVKLESKESLFAKK